MKNYEKFIKENLDYPINKINIILDNMTMPIKFKIFDMTEEKGDIQLALFELSQRPEDFDKIWKEVESKLYFYHQESNVYTESTLDESDEISEWLKDLIKSEELEKEDLDDTFVKETLIEQMIDQFDNELSELPYKKIESIYNKIIKEL